MFRPTSPVIQIDIPKPESLEEKDDEIIDENSNSDSKITLSGHENTDL